MEERNEIELDFMDLLRYLKRKIAILLIAAAVGGIFGFVYTKITARPVYTADITLYLMSRQYDNSVTYSDFQISQQIVYDYEKLVKSRAVTDEVIEKLDLNMTNAQVAGKITVTYETMSRVVKVTVADSDPQRAADIANSVGYDGSMKLAELMPYITIALVDEARVPTHGAAASATSRAVLMAVVAAVLVAGVLAVMRVLDDTIRTDEDVERHLGLSTLGIIPQAQELESKAAPKAASRVAKPAPKNTQPRKGGQ